jgi:hypothetical protein
MVNATVGRENCKVHTLPLKKKKKKAENVRQVAVQRHEMQIVIKLPAVK